MIRAASLRRMSKGDTVAAASPPFHFGLCGGVGEVEGQGGNGEIVQRSERCRHVLITTVKANRRGQLLER